MAMFVPKIWALQIINSLLKAEAGDAEAGDVEEADMASSEEGDGDEEEEDSSGKV